MNRNFIFKELLFNLNTYLLIYLAALCLVAAYKLSFTTWVLVP